MMNEPNALVRKCGSNFSEKDLMSDQFDTPILIVAWNRPAHARRLVDSVRPFRPSQVWVSVDGPRDSSDVLPIERTKKSILDSLDWACNIRTQFHESNLGCREGVSSALDWFFAGNDEGIILEDDLVLGSESLPFLQAMLEKYRDEPRVMSVSADNSLGVKVRDGSSYFFLGFPHVWGWATWKRAWSLYDRNMDSWIAARSGQGVSSFFSSSQSEHFWARLFDRVAFEPKLDSWAWCWAATHFAHGGLSVQAGKNLVSNAGFDSSATHTESKTERANANIETIFPLRHPCRVAENKVATLSTYKKLSSLRSASRTRRFVNAMFRLFMRPLTPRGLRSLLLRKFH